MMTRAAIYARVSTEDQAKEGFSLDAQTESLRNYCKARGWEIAGEYVDDGHSGRNTRRPAYQKMMGEKEKWDTILVVKMDRIHRNSRNFMEMMDNLRKWEKEFSSMQESLDTSTAMGRFVVDIIQRIAQLESEQIGERVYTGMRQKASTVGGILGFNIPYGYDYKDRKLIINHKEAEIIKYIFKECVNESSMGTIVKKLNEKKVPTKKGGRWAKQTISGILKNSLYCGFTQWEEILKKGEHDPIVDTRIFNKVQEIIKRRTKNTNIKQKIVMQIEDKILKEQKRGSD